MLPRVDLLAGYNYLSNPLTINLQIIKDGVVFGSSQQSVYTANEVYRQITGQDLPGRQCESQDAVFRDEKDD